MTIHLDSLKSDAEKMALRRDHVLTPWKPEHLIFGLSAECINCSLSVTIRLKEPVVIEGRALNNYCSD